MSINEIIMYQFIIVILFVLETCCIYGAINLFYEIMEELPYRTFIANVLLDAKLDLKYTPNIINQLRFYLHEKKGNGISVKTFISINNTTGVMRTSKRIDRENMCPRKVSCQLQLNIVIQPAEYFEIIPATIEIIDLNDNAPEFQRNMIDKLISESAFPGTRIPLPIAEDLDSNLFGIQSYRLISDHDAFELQVANNSLNEIELSLILRTKLDREVEEEFSIEILALDGGSPHKSGAMVVKIIIIDANDNNPIFLNKTYKASILKSAPIGTKFVQVEAFDLDKGENGQVVYLFTSDTINKYGNLFAIDEFSGKISIEESLHYEHGSLFILNVMAQDKGPDSLPAYVKVTVKVININDNKPYITVNALTTSGYAEVHENAKIGQFVAHVSVTSLDISSKSFFDCNILSPQFSIKRLYKKEFKIITKIELDREIQSQYYLTIMCHDRSIPTRIAKKDIIIRIVDSNDHAPTFQHRINTAKIRENNMKNVFIMQVVAYDKDIGNNANIEYKIINDSDSTLFIDATTGILRANRVFDYEKEQELEYIVEAFDNGLNPKASRALIRIIIVDSNDEVPEFDQSNYKFTVLENTHIETYVGITLANDRDSDPYNRITYFLSPENDALKSFHIDPNSGEIITKEILDREEHQVYHLIVVASNNDHPMMKNHVNVTIIVEDENDNPPIIDFPNEWNHTVSLSHDAKIGHHITQIRAHDFDNGRNAKLSYFIFKGNDMKYFDLNQTTGVLLVNQKLKVEGYQIHQMQIIVKDNGFPQNEALMELVIVINSSFHSNQMRSQNIRMHQLEYIFAVAGASIIVTTIIVFTSVIFCCRLNKKCFLKKAKTSYKIQEGENYESWLYGIPEHTHKNLQWETVPISPLSTEVKYQLSNQNITQTAQIHVKRKYNLKDGCQYDKENFIKSRNTELGEKELECHVRPYRDVCFDPFMDDEDKLNITENIKNSILSHGDSDVNYIKHNASANHYSSDCLTFNFSPTKSKIESAKWYDEFSSQSRDQLYNKKRMNNKRFGSLPRHNSRYQSFHGDDDLHTSTANRLTTRSKSPTPHSNHCNNVDRKNVYDQHNLKFDTKYSTGKSLPNVDCIMDTML